MTFPEHEFICTLMTLIILLGAWIVKDAFNAIRRDDE